jgi:imidazolonepropionase-like amidohydrolase
LNSVAGKAESIIVSPNAKVHGMKSGRPIVLYGLLLGFTSAFGQSSVPSYNRLHAIVGARIEIGDGRILEKANLIIRDGIIADLGANATVPPGADVVDGKGLFVYPGFIDAYTTKGLKLPDAQPDQDSPAPIGEYASARMREANRRGIRPEVAARDWLNITEDFAKPYRAAGFTTVMVIPGNGYLTGMGSLVNLSGRPNREAVVLPQTGFGLNFDATVNGGAAYPDSLLGRITMVRQALVDSRWQDSVRQSYLAGGLTRPYSDTPLDYAKLALYKAAPIFAEASTVSQIDQTLKVLNEFEIKPILVGAMEGAGRVEAIRNHAAGIVLSLAFNDEPGSQKSTDDATLFATVTEPTERLAERKRLYNRLVGTAQAFQQAAIPFALTTTGTHSIPDFLAALRKVVKSGLPRESALRALTFDAARLLKQDSRLGTLEIGKVANITVMTTDFLDEKMKVQVAFIDGHKIDPNRESSGPAYARQAAGSDRL